MQIFDRPAHLQHLARRRPEADNFLRAEITARLLDRLEAIRRPFPRVLELGGGSGELAAALAELGRTPDLHVALTPLAGPLDGRLGVVGDEEWLPFAAASFDAVLGVMGLNWVNDLPGTLAQIAHSLVPDGLFLAGFVGGESLHELRWSLTQAELEITGGAHARVSPFVDVRDAGALLQRAGLALPVSDCDRLTVTYGEPMRLLADLRALGAANVLLDRPRSALRRDVLARAMTIYRDEFGLGDGTVPATLDLLFLIGWKTHHSQPRAKARGSAQIDLARVFDRDPDRREDG